MVLMASLSCRISPRTSTVIFFDKIAVGDGNRDFGDIAHLRRQIRRHGVHAFGQVLPYSGDFAHLGLAAELAVGADFARHARDFRGENAELLDHRVDDVRGTQELALQRPAVDIQRHGLQQIAARDRGHRARHRGGRPQQVIDQCIDGAFHVGPGAVGQTKADPGARLALMPHHLAHVLELLRDALVGGDDGIEGIADFAGDAGLMSGQAHRKIAGLHGMQRVEQFMLIELRLRSRGR